MVGHYFDMILVSKYYIFFWELHDATIMERGKNRRKAEDRFTTWTRSTRGDKNQSCRVSRRTFYGFSKR